MRPRDLPEQLVLDGTVANDVTAEATLDDVLGPSRRVSPGDRALATQAGNDGALVASTLQRRRDNGARGRLAQRHGAAWESHLILQFERMERPGPDRLLAWSLQVFAQAKFIRRGSEKTLTYVERAAADFVAMSLRGRAIVVEAKSVSYDRNGKPGRLALDDVRPQQRDHLAATHKHNGLALVAVEFRLPGPKGHVDELRRFAVPWQEMPWTVGGRGGWSVGHEDLAGYEMPPETGPRHRPFLARFLGAA